MSSDTLFMAVNATAMTADAAKSSSVNKDERVTSLPLTLHPLDSGSNCCSKVCALSNIDSGYTDFQTHWNLSPDRHAHYY